MMHGRGKSDSAIVAVKPTNKAERSAAEPVEPRAEAEGNAGQQSTRRAQSRGRVSQGLERIRQVRRHTPKVGAVCPNRARTVLCGGRSAMSVPTAIEPLRNPSRSIGGLRRFAANGVCKTRARKRRENECAYPPPQSETERGRMIGATKMSYRAGLAPLGGPCCSFSKARTSRAISRQVRSSV